jgi:hypothetical protein
MSISTNYDKILEDAKKGELEWIEEEFDFLFKNKNGKCSEIDKSTANRILHSAKQNLDMIRNDKLMVILTKTLECIEQKYPELF